MVYDNNTTSIQASIIDVVVVSIEGFVLGQNSRHTGTS
jgi:hypothetical protein